MMDPLDIQEILKNKGEMNILEDINIKDEPFEEDANHENGRIKRERFEGSSGNVRRNSTDCESSSKKARKVLSLREKIILLDKLRCGVKISKLARECGVNESTVRTIKKGEEKIRASVNNFSPPNAKVCFRRRDPNMEKMEKLLNYWIENKSQQRAPISGSIICEKALTLYDLVKRNEGESSGTYSFSASKGWLQNFKQRFNLLKVNMTGESASADHLAADRFPAEFLKVFEDNGYLPEQVFNAVETGLFWKKMPTKTYLAKEEKTAPGFKAARDRISLVLCCNASGYVKCKPMLVYRAENPRALKGKQKHRLPVFWKSNPNAWVSARLFEDWFHNCFVHEVRDYLKSKNLPFKVLLLLDNSPAHPAALEFANEDVQVMFLPPNTPSLLQPMDQGVVTFFRSYYTQINFVRLLSAMDRDNSAGVHDSWRLYTILDAINDIKQSLDEINPLTVNMCWEKIWPEAVNDFKSLPKISEEVSKIVQMARVIGGEGFEDLEDQDVSELLDSHDQDLTEEELKEMMKDVVTEVESDDEPAAPQVTSKALAELIKYIETGEEMAVTIDPFVERSLKFKRALEFALAPYREAYKKLKTRGKQSNLPSVTETPPDTPIIISTATSPQTQSTAKSPHSHRSPQVDFNDSVNTKNDTQH